MSEQRLSSIPDVSVEEQVIDAVDDTDDAIVKIIENVEINLLQEEINKLKDEKALIESKKSAVLTKFLIVFFGSFFSMMAGFVLGTVVISNLFISFVTILSLVTMIVFPLYIVNQADKVENKEADIECLLKSKRQEMFEKSLKVKIAQKDETVIDEKWREVAAFDENDDYVKFLVRIVENDENGKETIEAKSLKS